MLRHMLRQWKTLFFLSFFMFLFSFSVVIPSFAQESDVSHFLYGDEDASPAKPEVSKDLSKRDVKIWVEKIEGKDIEFTKDLRTGVLTQREVGARLNEGNGELPVPITTPSSVSRRDQIRSALEARFPNAKDRLAAAKEKISDRGTQILTEGKEKLSKVSERVGERREKISERVSELKTTDFSFVFPPPDDVPLLPPSLVEGSSAPIPGQELKPVGPGFVGVAIPATPSSYPPNVPSAPTASIPSVQAVPPSIPSIPQQPTVPATIPQVPTSLPSIPSVPEVPKLPEAPLQLPTVTAPTPPTPAPTIPTVTLPSTDRNLPRR